MKRLQIERRDNVSRSDFARDYLTGLGAPVVLTDATRHWPALSKWTFEFFKTSYGSQFAKAPTSLKSDTSKMTKVATYIDYLDKPDELPGLWLERSGSRPVLDAPAKSAAPPYLMGWHPFRSHPELYDDISPAPEFVDDLVLAFDPVVRDVFQWAAGRDYWSIFIGPAGSLSELHQDYWSTHVYLAQIQGRKRAILFSPADTEFLYGGSVDPDNPDFDRYPQLANATAYECEIGPGDLLFMPPNWWHWVLGLEKSITVSHNFFNSLNINQHLISLIRKTPKLVEALDVFPEWKETIRPQWTSNGFADT